MIELSDRDSQSNSRNRAQTAGIALLMLLTGLLLLAAPVLLGRWEYNKYIVVTGFLILCLGLSILLNVLIDTLRGPR